MWTLLLSRQGDPPGTFIDRRQLDHGQIKVGRSAATCDLVVPDTAGHLSREHCVIAALGFDLFVTDLSTNGVALNQPGQRIAPQAPVGVRVGDRLLIGDFVIEIATEAAGMAAQLHAPLAQAPAPVQSIGQPDAWFDTGPSDPIWGAGASKAEVHDFLGDAMHDFLGGPARNGAGAPPAAAFDPLGGALGEAFSKPMLSQPVTPAPEAYAIPEDWAAPMSPAPAAPTPAAAMPARPPATHADPFAPPAARPHDPFASPTAPSDPLGMPAAGADPFAGIDHPSPFSVAPSPPADEPVSDPFAGFVSPDGSHDRLADASASPQPEGDPFAGFAPPGGAPDHPFAAFPPSVQGADPFAPDSTPAASPSRSGAGDASATAPAAPTPPGQQQAGGEADWAAFCQGAGMERADLRLGPDAMRRLGVLYRQVVLGLSDLIQDRAAFKDEFRVERTQLSFGRNNPLKHLAPLDSAKLLLADPLPGFMDAEDAVRAGLEDVKKHQLALLAGVQHALRTVFERLSPTEVDRVMKKARSAKRGLLGRGVDPWSVYQTMWEALRTDATSNVNSVMSVAFREGYEAFLNGGKGAG